MIERIHENNEQTSKKYCRYNIWKKIKKSLKEIEKFWCLLLNAWNFVREGLPCRSLQLLSP